MTKFDKIVSLERVVNNLQNSELRQLNSIHDLLEPFAQYISLVSGNDCTTISSVVPVIMELNLCLGEMRKKGGMTAATKVLEQEIKRRFQHFMDPTDECFEPLYLMTTALDPRFTLILTSEAAEAELTNQLGMSSEDTTTTSIEEAGSEGIVTE